jgi:hypothetical protein
MGRPLNKKYFGNRNLGADGNDGALNTASDAGLGGEGIASVTVSTAGSFTSAPTITVPKPALSSEGAVTATVTPTYKAVSATIGGTQATAYAAGTGTITSYGATWTPTLTTYSGFSIASITSGGVMTLSGGTITAVAGTSVTFNAGLTGSTGLTAGATYYVVASVTSSSTVTLSSTYGGGAIAITGGTPTGTLTLTIGTTFASVASVAVANGGSYTTLPSGAQATTATSGSGLTLTITSGIASIAVNNKGTGYFAASTGSTTITATTATSTATSITSTIANNVLTVTAVTGTITNGMVLTGGTVTAGAYIVNQVTPLTSGEATGGIGRYYIEKFGGGAITGTPTTGTLNPITVSSTVDIVPGMTFTVASNVGGLTTSGSPYYVMTVLGPNTIQVSSTYGGTSAVTTSTTTSQNVTATFGQNLVLAFSAGGSAATLVPYTTSSAAGKVGVASENIFKAIQVTAYIPAANGGKAARQDSDIVAQKGSHRYKVENQDGTGVIKLVAGAITVGTGVITATDYNGSTYYVTKLTARKALLTQKTVSGSFQFASGKQVPWTLGSAVTGYSVQIDSK